MHYVAKKGGVLVGFHERKSSFVADMRSCEVLPPAVSKLIVPLREMFTTMALRERLPQVELAVGESVTILVLRHLEPVGEEDAREAQRRSPTATASSGGCSPRGRTPRTRSIRRIRRRSTTGCRNSGCASDSGRPSSRR